MLGTIQTFWRSRLTHAISEALELKRQPLHFTDKETEARMKVSESRVLEGWLGRLAGSSLPSGPFPPRLLPALASLKLSLCLRLLYLQHSAIPAQHGWGKGTIRMLFPVNDSNAHCLTAWEEPSAVTHVQGPPTRPTMTPFSPPPTPVLGNLSQGFGSIQDREGESG